MSFFTKKTFSRNGKPYLTRYTVFKTKLFSLKIHHILTSDPVDYHTHPWDFFSLVLWGGYLEHSPNHPRYVKRYYAGNILYRPANFPHRLEIEKPAWTLFFAFGKRKKWGFIVKEKFVHWKKYFA